MGNLPHAMQLQVSQVLTIAIALYANAKSNARLHVRVLRDKPTVNMSAAICIRHVLNQLHAIHDLPLMVS